MSRVTALEVRRRELINRCEEQRLELAYRFAQIKPREQLTAWTRRSATGSAAKNPIAWIAGIAGLLLMMRRRRGTLSGVGWITGLVALATRATTILRVLAQARAVYRGFKAGQQR